MSKAPKTRSAEGGDVRYIELSAPDGARSIVGELGGDLWSLGGSSFLVLPSDRLAREVKRSIEAGVTDRILTVQGLARHLYDLYGGQWAVRDSLFRTSAISIILEDPYIRTLRPKGGDPKGMARHISEAVRELLVNGRAPEDLERVARTGRSVELAFIFRRYMEELRGSRSIDIEEVPSKASAFIEEDGSRVAGHFFGIYMPGRLDRSYSTMLSSLLGACRGAIVAEHRLRGAPDLLGHGYLRSGTTIIPPAGSSARETVRWPKKVGIIRGEDRISTLRAVCRHVKRLIVEDRMDPRDISIVTPGGSLHERYIPTVLTEFGIPYSMDREVQVSEVPAVSGTFGALSLPLNGWGASSLAECLTAFSGALSPDGPPGVTGPELALAFSEVQMFGGPDIDRDWTRPLAEYAGAEGKEEAICNICRNALRALPPVLTRLKDLSGQARDPRVMANDVRSFLAFLRSSMVDGVRSDPREEAVRKLDRAIAGVPSLVPRTVETIDLRGFMDLLSLCLEDVKVELLENGEGVWVGKVKQQSGRKCRALILHSMTDGEYPQRSPDFRVLNGEERAALSLRERPDRREALEDIAVCMTSGEGQIVSIHRTQSDRPVSISTMLEDLELEEIDVGSDPRSRMEVLRLAACSEEDLSIEHSGRMEVHDPRELLLSLEGGKEVWDRIAGRRDARGSEESIFRGRILDSTLLDSLSRRFGDDHVWSVSQLETYRQCPYEFFVRYVLGIRPMERMEPEVPMDRRGTIVHSILEGFYKRWRHRGKARVRKGEEDEAFQVMTASAREVLSSYPYEGPFWDALSDLLLGVNGEKGILMEFIEEEAGYGGPFTVEEMELRFGKDAPARIEGSGGGLLIAGIIDRIDAFGQLRMIWDYKTGSRKVEKRSSLQVPLYLASLKALRPEWRMAGGGYYMVGGRGKVERMRVLGDDSDPARSIGEVDEEIAQHVDTAIEKIGSIRGGTFTRSGSCPHRSYCEYFDICRRDET